MSGVSVDINLKRENFSIVINEQFKNGITGIFGPSGSGKTSLLNSIAGIEHSFTGSIKFNSIELYNSSKALNTPVQKRKIGYVFQDPRLFPHKTVDKNLRYSYKDDDDVFFNEIVQLLEIEHLLTRKPYQISGGERQRVAIGRALLMNPRLLLMDEPFSALDTNLRSQIITYIKRIQEVLQIPIIIVSHDFTDLLKLTDYLCIIKDGKCIANGKYANLILKKELHEHFSTFSFTNVLTLTVFANHPQLGITILSVPNSKEQVTILCDKDYGYYKIGQIATILLSPEDIALSISKAKDISIQNQVRGQIQNIFFTKSRVRCIIDIGVPIIVDVSFASYERLDLQIGKKLWCLFKSVSLFTVD